MKHVIAWRSGHADTSTPEFMLIGSAKCVARRCSRLTRVASRRPRSASPTRRSRQSAAPTTSSASGSPGPTCPRCSRLGRPGRPSCRTSARPSSRTGRATCRGAGRRTRPSKAYERPAWTATTSPTGRPDARSLSPSLCSLALCISNRMQCPMLSDARADRRPRARTGAADRGTIGRPARPSRAAGPRRARAPRTRRAGGGRGWA